MPIPIPSLCWNVSLLISVRPSVVPPICSPALLSIRLSVFAWTQHQQPHYPTPISLRNQLPLMCLFAEVPPTHTLPIGSYRKAGFPGT